jgi:hypothetical protein
MIFTGLGKDFSNRVGAAGLIFTRENPWLSENAAPLRPNQRQLIVPNAFQCGFFFGVGLGEGWAQTAFPVTVYVAAG